MKKRNISEIYGKITTIVRSNFAPKQMRDALGAYHEKDIASTLPLLTEEERQRLFCVLLPQELAEILQYAEQCPLYFAGMPFRKKTELLSHMQATNAAELLQSCEKEERNALLDRLPETAREEIGLICSFDEEMLGSRMSTDFIVIPDTAGIKEAMSRLIELAAEHNNIATLFVTDAEGVFCGAIDLKDLILAREGTPLDDITTTSYPYVYANMLIADSVPYLMNYTEVSIPVLDDANHLVGVVTAQDFVELLDDEMGEDYARLAGLSAEEDLAEPIAESMRKRVPWLCILLVMGLGVSTVVGLFEAVVAQLPVIMCFQSLILDMAGNVGTQSLAVAIRVLMDAHIGRREKTALVWKELRIGLLNGCVLGLLSFAAVGGYLRLTGTPAAFAIAGCLGAAMILAMLISAMSGTLIPLFFRRLGVDPAVASGPLITTVNDLVAVVTYYGLSWLILLQWMQLG